MPAAYEPPLDMDPRLVEAITHGVRTGGEQEEPAIVELPMAMGTGVSSLSAQRMADAQAAEWGDWDPKDNPATSHGFSSRAAYEAACKAAAAKIELRTPMQGRQASSNG